MTSAETRTEQHTLSTGHSVELPLECTCTVAGATFTATADRLNELLPTELTPIRIGPRTGLLSLLTSSHRPEGRGIPDFGNVGSPSFTVTYFAVEAA